MADGPVSGWTLAKYLLAFAGLAIVLLGDHRSMPGLGYLGLALIVAAFLLRFLQRIRPAKKAVAQPEDED